MVGDSYLAICTNLLHSHGVLAYLGGLMVLQNGLGFAMVTDFCLTRPSLLYHLYLGWVLTHGS